MATNKNTGQQQRARALKSSRTKAPTAAALKKRRAETFQLRLAGATYRDIAEKFDVSVGTAYQDVQHVFDEMLPAEDVEKQRKLELQRMDRLRLGLWSAATRGSTQAVDSYLRVSARFARLAGLDAPVRVAGHDGGGLFPVESVPAKVLAEIVQRTLQKDEQVEQVDSAVVK